MEHEVLDDAFFLLVAVRPGDSQDAFIRNAIAFLLKYVFKLQRSQRNRYDNWFACNWSMLEFQ